jgi:uroporphyrinogen-III synthase
VYERVLPQLSPSFIDSIWRNNLVDVILITSEQSLDHLFKLFGEDAKSWLESKTYCFISKRLAKAATVLALKKQLISHPNRILETLFEYHKGLTYGQRH